MRFPAHKIVAKAPLSPPEIALMKEMVIKAVEVHNERVNYSEYKQVILGGVASSRGYSHPGYGIQYVAYFNEKQEKVIWINGFAKASSFHSEEGSAYFEATVVDAEDGGNGYFETILNLTTGRAADFSIHGSA
ncbi:hypothetical protein QMK33_18130 [Hymenobacter sp. H14-R3]|uniref:hypothetical protein n=1 Tax=Hymenobacter sp. H14-R3 TaxID=3046308 RepID=UPI0024BB5D66|nr:hypothetical protein [Hymenobacter sp. H14-R3]MDJ0367072.1 hypothetical protein [Hymenobacter sp. H14-R3]